MHARRRFFRCLITLSVGVLVSPGPARAQTSPDQYKPQVGQPGKDAVWVPTSPALVEKMLDMAKVTPSDFVMDLGSGDGRNVIAAAKRGARGLGVEYNPDLVAFSTRAAAAEGVADKAKFVQGDMYAADISQATVLALFLLTENLDRLVPKFLALKPGTRIVANTFGMTGWTPDESETLQGDCTSWCTSLLWIVPARVEGTWRMPHGELTLKQEFQMVSGSLSGKAISNGRLRGDQIRFSIDGVEYEGRVTGNTIAGTVTNGESKSNWRATRYVGLGDRKIGRSEVWCARQGSNLQPSAPEADALSN
jgi:SAM-dependent methyltransferase